MLSLLQNIWQFVKYLYSRSTYVLSADESVEIGCDSIEGW